MREWWPISIFRYIVVCHIQYHVECIYIFACIEGVCVCLQVDFLQQTNQDLESKLKDAESANTQLQGRVQELSGKNAKICEGEQTLMCIYQFLSIYLSIYLSINFCLSTSLCRAE